MLGAAGALGRASWFAFREGHDAYAMPREELDITDGPAVGRMLSSIRPDVVVNCAGAIPEREARPAAMVAVNAVAPLLLAAWCRHYDARLIHVSTDCVFRPDSKRWHFATEAPDAIDVYGRSKALGEMGQGMTAVRTSFVSPDHGVWRWLVGMAAAGAETVPGWMQAWWSGSTVWAVADGLVKIAEGRERNAVEHLATSEMISKHEVLARLAKRLGLSLEIEGLYEPRIMRGLYPTIALQPFEEALSARAAW